MNKLRSVRVKVKFSNEQEFEWLCMTTIHHEELTTANVNVELIDDDNTKKILDVQSVLLLEK